MHKVKGRNGLIMSKLDNGKPGNDIEEIEGAIQEFRDSVRAEADRPDFFWTRQRSAILSALNRIESPKRRPLLLWIPAAAAVLLCMLFFADISKAPAPDLAAGYDQDLLVEVERALNQRHPEALKPALLIIQEMEHDKTIAKQP